MISSNECGLSIYKEKNALSILRLIHHALKRLILSYYIYLLNSKHLFRVAVYEQKDLSSGIEVPEDLDKL